MQSMEPLNTSPVRVALCRAATEVCSDHESPELTKNVVELLSPFLPPQPKKAGSQPAVSNDADAATAAAAAAADFPASPSVLSTEVEHAQVQAFVDKQAANSGLQAVAASLLNTLFSGQSKAVALDLAEDVMQLEAAVQGEENAHVVQLAKCCIPSFLCLTRDPAVHIQPAFARATAIAYLPCLWCKHEMYCLKSLCRMTFCSM